MRIAENDCTVPGVVAISQTPLVQIPAVIGTFSSGLNEVSCLQMSFSLLKDHKADDSDVARTAKVYA